MKKIIITTNSALSMMLFYAAISEQQLLQAKNQCSHEHNSWVTIFIHGTVGLRPNLNLTTFFKLIRDDIDTSCYKNIVTEIRNDTFFFHGQPMQALGLHKISNPDHATTCSTRLFAHLYKEFSPPEECSEYYTFGWHGLVSHKNRYLEAKNLYRALQNLRAEKRKICPTCDPKIRLVCYSHGGSVALNLAAVQEKEFPLESLTIHELIMLGSPVQKETDFYICSPLFKKIYHFYSRGDRIQKLDCFSLKRFFSNRRFNTHRRLKLPDKLTQIEIKLKHSAQRSLDHSPNHTELWFFGWSPRSIRENFVIYPLPCAVLLPSFIALVEKHMPQSRHIVMTLYPDTGTARLRERHQHKYIKAPWINRDIFKGYQEQVENCKPLHFTQEQYQAHLQNAVRLATPEDTLRQKKYALCMCGLTEI